jgi:exopolysaccharide production protein ExoQ
MTAATCIISRQQESERPVLALSFAVGFYFAFRLFIMLLSVRVFGAAPQTGVEISLVLNIVFLMAVAFCSPNFARRPLWLILQPASVRWAMLFLMFSGCSLLWSVTVSVPAAVAYWCAMAADSFIVILMLRTGEAATTVSSLMKGYIWGACAIAIIAWIMPAQSDLRLGDEELLGPNQIGYLCAFSIYFAQYLSRLGGRRMVGPVLLLALTLLRSLSKTTIIAFLISQAFLLLRDSSMSRRQKILLVLASIAIIGMFAGLLSSYLDVYADAGNQSETLTGRLGIWSYLLAETADNPWFGHGFHSVWKVVPPFGPDQFEARHAHNELLQQLYAYGIAGVVLLVGIYGSIFLQVRRLTPGALKTFFYAFLIFIWIRGLADTEPFDLSLPLWTIILISAQMVSLPRAKEVIANVIPL